MRKIMLIVLFLGSTSQHFDDITRINDISSLENFAPQLDLIKKIVKEKCANEKSFEILMNQPIELNSCLENYLNFTEIKTEFEESKKTGSMDDVFKKYCSRYPHIHRCLENVADKLRPCLNSSEEQFLDKGLEFVGTLKEYMCFKDGNRMALFISQGGIECVELKKDQIQQCVNGTVGDSLPPDVSLTSLPELLRFNGSTLCNDLDEMRFCFYETLTTCKQNIPANVIDAFFKFFKKYISCETSFVYGESTSDDITIRVIIVILFLLLVALCSYKLASYNGQC